MRKTKNARRIISMLLALILMFALVTPVFAEEEAENSGAVILADVIEEQAAEPAPQAAAPVAAVPELQSTVPIINDPAATADADGVLYVYDTTGVLFTGTNGTYAYDSNGILRHGSREEFNTPNTNDPYFCPTDSHCDDDHNIPGHAAQTQNQYVICVDPAVVGSDGITYQEIIHRHAGGTDNANKIVYIVALDSNGNGNILYQGAYYATDTEKPTAPTVSADKTEWTNQDVTVEIGGSTDTGTVLELNEATPTNDGKGLNHYEYSIDGGATIVGLEQLPGDAAAAEAETQSIVISEEGEQTIAVRAVDNGKNTSEEATITVRIDKTNPELSVTGNLTDETYNAVSLTLLATDGLSGVANIVLPDGTMLMTPDGIFRATENGTYTFQAYDNAGNLVEQIIEVTNIRIYIPPATPQEPEPEPIYIPTVVPPEPEPEPEAEPVVELKATPVPQAAAPIVEIEPQKFPTTAVLVGSMSLIFIITGTVLTLNEIKKRNAAKAASNNTEE